MFRTKTNKIDVGIIARFCLTMKPEIGFQVYPNREQSVNKYWKNGCLQIPAPNIEGALLGMKVMKLVKAESWKLASTPSKSEVGPSIYLKI